MNPDIRPVADVLGISVDAVNMDSALDRVQALLNTRRKSYICVAGVHGVMEAQRNPALRQVYAAAAMTIPDGMPLVWVGRHQGHTTMQRVTGPDIMFEIFRRAQFAHLTHYFYGGEPGVAEQLRRRFNTLFPRVHIVGEGAPPFRDLTPAELAALAAELRSLRPDILWVGTGCPRQELFMARCLPLLETPMMIGVGAAFDFHTGRIRDCAPWIKTAGLQWFHRLLQDPRRLWKRYARNNPAFLYRMGLQLLHESRSGQATSQLARNTAAESAGPALMPAAPLPQSHSQTVPEALP